MRRMLSILAAAVVLAVLVAATASPLSPPITTRAMASSASPIAVIVELDKTDQITGRGSALPKGNY